MNVFAIWSVIVAIGAVFGMSWLTIESLREDYPLHVKKEEIN